MATVRCTLNAIAVVLVLALGSGSTSPPQPSLQYRVDRALLSAMTFLFDQQDDDGAWRSATYGVHRDGPSLTAHVVAALVTVAPNDPRTQQGLAYLAALASSEGEIQTPLLMPVYTASLASQAFITVGRHDDARPWLELLLAHQLAGERGWSLDDVQYGGWGYSAHPPVRPESDEAAARIDANISATVYALESLRRAHEAGAMKVSDRVSASALQFVSVCQNRGDSARSGFHYDGGFFFTPIDAARNKAGSVLDRGGNEVFRSYGSTTTDGYRALALAGVLLCRDRTPRLRHAAGWLNSNFDAANVPGNFGPDREVLRDAYYFYYACSLGQALQLPVPANFGIKDREEKSQALAVALLHRQSDDGSWINRFTDGRENDPIIATSFAVLALSSVRSHTR